jgi:hypothetical protein
MGWIGDLANIVVGGFGLVQGEKEKSEARDVAKKASKTQEALMKRNLSYSDEVLEPLFRYFVGGGRAIDLDLPGFSEQFDEIDTATANQLRALSASSQEAQQMVADNMTGGAKLRALANIARIAQDNKQKIISEAAQKRRDLDINLTNQWAQEAARYRPGVSPGTVYQGEQRNIESALGAYGNTQENLKTIAGALGNMYGGKDVEKNVVSRESRYPGGYGYGWEPPVDLVDLDDLQPKKKSYMEDYYTNP